MRVIAPHGHVIGADDVAEHAQVVRGERDRVVVELLQVDGRRLVDVDAALGEIAPARVHPLHEVRDCAPGVADEPADVRELFEHARVAELRDRDRRVERKPDDRSEHVLGERLRRGRDHRMDEDADASAICLLEEWPIDRIRESAPADVR